jgi:hypothetical protein
MTGRRLIFHIGHHKTGSTAIQDALATGALSVPGRRILYTARMAHNYLRRHFDAVTQRGQTLPGSDNFPGLDRLSALLAAGDYDDAVFSAEEFEGADPAQMQAVLAQYFLPHVADHRILAWVRPHAARTLSSFAEQVKLGLFDGDPAQFHKRTRKAGRFIYATRLAPWVETFGPRLTVRPMVRDVLVHGSVVQDFIAHGFDVTPPPPARPEVANESLCLEDLVILRHLQASLQGQGRGLRHAFGWEMAHHLGAHRRPGTRTALALHKRLAEQIRADYRDDAKGLDATLFAATPVMLRELDRAVDTAVDQPQSFEPTDHFSADDLRWMALLAETAAMAFGNAGTPWQPYLQDRRVARLHGPAGT